MSKFVFFTHWSGISFKRAAKSKCNEPFGCCSLSFWGVKWKQSASVDKMIRWLLLTPNPNCLIQYFIVSVQNIEIQIRLKQCAPAKSTLDNIIYTLFKGFHLFKWNMWRKPESTCTFSISPRLKKNKKRGGQDLSFILSRGNIWGGGEVFRNISKYNCGILY